MANPLDRTTSVRGPAQPGDMLCYTGRSKETGNEKEVQVVRTDRPYAYDLADAYNATNVNPECEWFVDPSGNLKYGHKFDFALENSKRIERTKETERARWMRSHLDNQPMAEAAE